MTGLIGTAVPWNALWTGEARYEVRPCRWAGRLALWQPHAPGSGKPVFADPHIVRQRQSIARMLCTVCGQPTHAPDRWWFGAPDVVDGYRTTTEAPVHRACVDHALVVCPHLRGRGSPPMRFPEHWTVLAAFIGGPAVERDFGLSIPADRQVVGHLKLAWPA